MGEFWQATTALADVLRASAPLQRFSGTWRGEPQEPESQLPQALGETLASFNMLRWQPFLFSLRFGQLQQGDALAGDRASDQFRTDSTAITGAMLALVEWLRSRLPRYPIRFRLPYTDPFSSRVAEGGFPDQQWPWALATRRMRLQARSSVAPVMARLLEVEEAPTRVALDELQRTLHATEAWQRYASAAAALTAMDEHVLAEILDSFRADVGLEAIRAVDQDRPVRRMMHRHAASRRAEAEAQSRGGAVAEYYAAFRLMDSMLAGFVAVLGQLLVFGSLDQIEIRRASWRLDAYDECVVVAVKTDDILRYLNILALELRAELVSLAGFVMVDGVNLSAKRRGDLWEEEVRLRGILLPESQPT